MFKAMQFLFPSFQVLRILPEMNIHYQQFDYLYHSEVFYKEISIIMQSDAIETVQNQINLSDKSQTAPLQLFGNIDTQMQRINKSEIFTRFQDLRF